jgi:hypothetical protein
MGRSLKPRRKGQSKAQKLNLAKAQQANRLKIEVKKTLEQTVNPGQLDRGRDKASF